MQFRYIKFMIITNKEQFFQLLNYSNNLKKQKRYLITEDRKSFNKLLKFLGTIERNFHYYERLEYISLIKDFLNNEITVENFADSFVTIFRFLWYNTFRN